MNDLQQCPICLKKIKKSYFRQHTLRNHPSECKLRTPNITCSLCEEKFTFRRDFRKHVSNCHERITESVLKMNDWEDFETWLKNEEEMQQIRFTRERAPHILSNGSSRINYYCQYDNSRQREILPPHERKRALKNKGSGKIGGCCPAEIVVEKCVSGEVQIQYFSTHFAHENRLAHFRLSSEDKSKLAEKIKAGLTFDRILDDVRDGFLKNSRREDFICRKTLHNIAAKLGISSWRRNANDGISLWIESVRKLSNNPICLLKMQGEKHPVLNENDFALVIVTEIQLKIMKEFGDKIICIDSAYGTNKNDFQLTTLLVVDDHEEGFPVAFLISNRTDTSTLNVFFESVLHKLSGVPLCPTVFMSDDNTAYFNAWCAIMKPIIFPKKIICPWHIDKNWRAALIKVKGERGIVETKQILVYQMLRSLLEELDESTFLENLGLVTTQLIKDESTQKFGKYFKRQYANCPEMWAYCYQIGCGINPIMKLENLHNLIKVVYEKGTKMQRINSYIDTLLKVTRDKYYDRVLKFSDMQMLCVVQKIDSAHRKCLEITDDDVHEEDSLFYVKSQTNEDIKYLVQKISDSCNCDIICHACDSCIHKYECCCPEYLIKCRMCKHIHKVCTLLRQKSSASFTNVAQIEPPDNDGLNEMMDFVIETTVEITEENNVLLDEVREQIKLLNVDLDLNQSVQYSPSSLRLVINHLKRVRSILNDPNNDDSKQKLLTSKSVSLRNKKIYCKRKLFSTKKHLLGVNNLNSNKPARKQNLLKAAKPEPIILSTFDHTY